MQYANHIRAIEQFAAVQRFEYAHFPVRLLDLRSFAVTRGHICTYMNTNVAIKTIITKQ